MARPLSAKAVIPSARMTTADQSFRQSLWLRGCAPSRTKCAGSLVSTDGTPSKRPVLPSRFHDGLIGKKVVQTNVQHMPLGQRHQQVRHHARVSHADPAGIDDMARCQGSQKILQHVGLADIARQGVARPLQFKPEEVGAPNPKDQQRPVFRSASARSTST